MDFIMKKFAVICLSLALLFSLSMTAFAAPSGFVSSPSGNAAPVLVSYSNESESCTAKVEVTPYSERDDLEPAIREKLEAAYAQILNSADGDAFSKILAQLAKSKNVSASTLSVSDLFDISSFGCSDHEGHGHFTVTLRAETLEHFVGLLHLYNGEWEIIKAEKNGDSITFDVKEFSPFAVVVDNGSGDSTPQTGDNSMIYLWVMVAAAAGLLLILVGMKKQKA